MLKRELIDRLIVQKYESREELGGAAGHAVIEKINELLKSKEEIRMVFAAAPSQNEMLEYLVSHRGEVDWKRVVAFHMDDYIGLDKGSQQSFSSFLIDKLFDHLPFKAIHLINSQNNEETLRYSRLLAEDRIDIVCLGIGENGHIAFNDPPVADFNDPDLVKIVKLDDACRIQQVNDGCFPSFEDVPEQAITLTIPALFGGTHLFCVVPGKTKSGAVHRTLNGDISEECPASILRTHPDCTLFVDKDSYPG